VVSEPYLAVGREPVVKDDRRSPRMAILENPILHDQPYHCYANLVPL
jgi:hypothetical protein